MKITTMGVMRRKIPKERLGRRRKDSVIELLVRKWEWNGNRNMTEIDRRK